MGSCVLFYAYVIKAGANHNSFDFLCIHVWDISAKCLHIHCRIFMVNLLLYNHKLEFIYNMKLLIIVCLSVCNYKIYQFSIQAMAYDSMGHIMSDWLLVSEKNNTQWLICLQKKHHSCLTKKLHLS